MATGALARSIACSITGSGTAKAVGAIGGTAKASTGGAGGTVNCGTTGSASGAPKRGGMAVGVGAAAGAGSLWAMRGGNSGWGISVSNTLVLNPAAWTKDWSI